MNINLRYVRYGIFFVSFLILISAGQVFIQNFNVNKTIKEIKTTQTNLLCETVWMKKYYNAFLKSPYAIYFFKHKQGISLNDEIKVKIQESYQVENTKKIFDKNNEKKYNNFANQKKWADFFTSLKDLLINN